MRTLDTVEVDLQAEIEAIRHLAALGHWIEAARVHVETTDEICGRDGAFSERLADGFDDGHWRGPSWDTFESSGLQALYRVIESKAAALLRSRDLE